MHGTFSNWLAMVRRTLAEEGVDLTAELARRGVHDLPPAGDRLPPRLVRAVWQVVDDATRRPAFGLAMLDGATFADFDELGVALVATGSLDEMIDRVVAYHELLTGTITVQRHDEGGLVGVRLPDRDGVSWRVHEFAAAVIVRVVRARFGRDAGPRRVALAYRNPAAAQTYARYFRVPVATGCAATTLFFDPSASSRPVGTLRVSERLEGLLADELRALHRGMPFSTRVEREVAAALGDGVPTLDQVARACNMSVRTLQRRLADEGRSFSEIVEDARRSLAREWVDGDALSLTEIAYLLGFATSSAFTRAYRRWYGEAPSDARRARAATE